MEMRYQLVKGNKYQVHQMGDTSKFATEMGAQLERDSIRGGIKDSPIRKLRGLMAIVLA